MNKEKLERLVVLIDEIMEIDPKSQEYENWLTRYRRAVIFDLEKALDNGWAVVSEADDNVRAVEEIVWLR